MDNLEHILSDVFVEFSQSIAEIHLAKKTRKQEFKEVYDEYHADIKALDEQAQQEIKKFEEWKKQHTKGAEQLKTGTEQLNNGEQ